MKIKKGAPISDVVMPSGISILEMQRLKSSTINRNKPPTKKDAGNNAAFFDPTNMRAMCGMTKPTQPTIPLMLTADAVISVAMAMTINRSFSTLIPIVLASSSPKESMSSFHPEMLSKTKPVRAIMPIKRRSLISIFDKPPISQYTIEGRVSSGSATYLSMDIRAEKTVATIIPERMSVRHFSCFFPVAKLMA